MRRDGRSAREGTSARKTETTRAERSARFSQPSRRFRVPPARVPRSLNYKIYLLTNTLLPTYPRAAPRRLRRRRCHRRFASRAGSPPAAASPLQRRRVPVVRRRRRLRAVEGGRRASVARSGMLLVDTIPTCQRERINVMRLITRERKERLKKRRSTRERERMGSSLTAASALLARTSSGASPTTPLFAVLSLRSATTNFSPSRPRSGYAAHSAK